MAKITETAKEIWKPIINYEGLYEVSDLGRIKSLKYEKQKILKQRRCDAMGHIGVALCKNNEIKTFYIHRLVLIAFVGPCPPGMECRHLDGNPQNNRLENLKWGTKSENAQDSIKHGTHYSIFPTPPKGSKHHSSKLNESQFRVITRLIEDDYLTQKEISEIFNVVQATISRIKNGIRCL